MRGEGVIRMARVRREHHMLCIVMVFGMVTCCSYRLCFHCLLSFSLCLFPCVTGLILPSRHKFSAFLL